MFSHFKAAVLCAAAALILAMPLAAQNATEELGPLESNTYRATAGLFGNDVDDYMDVHSYGDVLPEGAKWFGFLTGSALTVGESPNTNPATGLLSLGYARQFGGIYVGLWYQGNIVQITGDHSKNPIKTSSIEPTYDTNGFKTLTKTETTTSWEESWLNTSNQIEALVGVAGQGIKIGFYESLFSNVHKGETNRSIVKTDYKNGIVDYTDATDEFYIKGGYIKPYLGWGSNLSVGGFGLRPYVNLGLTFGSDTQVDNYSNYTKVNGKRLNDTNNSNNVGEGWDKTFLRPEIGVGAWFDFAAKEGAKASTTLGIEYGLGVYLYNSSYAPTGLSGDNVKGTVEWDTGYVNRKTTNSLSKTVSKTDIDLTIDEITELQHSIIPTYIISGDPVENFSLGFQASLPVGIRTYTSEKHDENHTIENTKFTTDTQRNTKDVTITRDAFESMQETELNIDLELAIGASYQLIPNRFTINAGIGAKPLAFTNTVTTHKAQSNDSIETQKVTDGLGNVITDSKKVTLAATTEDKVESTTTWDGFSGDVTGGFTFFFTNNIALDLAAKWSGGTGTNADDNSFRMSIANVHVLFSFKF